MQVIKSMLDPKIRFLPSMLGIFSSFSYFRHAYCQGNFTLSNVKLVQGQQSDNLAILLYFCKAVQFGVHTLSSRLREFERQVRSASILGTPIIDVLEQHANSGIDCVKSVRALLKLRSSMNSEIKGVEFSPDQSGNVRVILRQKQSEVYYKTFEGAERVNYRSVSCRGQFTHDGHLITSIVCNVFLTDEIRVVLAAIGTYCKVDFMYDKSRNFNQMQDSKFEEFRKCPWIVARCTKPQWHKFNTMKPGKVEELYLKTETEFEEGAKKSCKLTEDLHIRYMGKVLLNTVKTAKLEEPISTLVKMSPGPLDDYLITPSRLAVKIRVYYDNFDYLMVKVRKMDYSWRNECFRLKIPTSLSKQISHTARLLIQKLLTPESADFWNPVNICFWY